MRLACPGLPAAFVAGAAIVTPTQLLASVANEQFTQAQLAAGHQTWRTPKILSGTTWLADRWQELRYNDSSIPALLSAAQERTAWQTLIESEHPALFDHQQAVTTAIAATRLIAEWHIPIEGDAWSTASDTRHFQRLYRLFRKRAAQENWTTRSDLWRTVAELRVEEPLALTAFATLSPALQQIVGATAVSIEYPRQKKLAALHSADTLTESLEQTARWARRQFESDPAGSVGILVADLFTHKHLVNKTFRDVFYSSAAIGFIETSIYHLHAPEPISQHPLVANALLLMQLALSRIPIANASAILRSPFLIEASSEQHKRALADLQLRRYRDLDVSLTDIEKATAGCPRLQATWKTIRPLLQVAPQTLALPAWSEFMGQLLAAVGWPGERKLTQGENQVVEEWKSALTQLAALGFVEGAVPFPVALQRLETSLASRTTEAGDLSSPIQILDASQAFGLSFRRAAIVNLSEDAWPAPVRPSPFIPLPLQRPYLDAQLHLRQRATEGLFQSAPDVVAVHVSPFAPSARPYVKPTKRSLPSWEGVLPGIALGDSDVKETLEDSAAPPFSSEAETVQGGVSILKSQSQCPFQAFAKYRLAANRPEDACFGFDARDRGSFLHRALEQVWLELQTRDHLRATSPEHRRDIIRHAVNAAVGDQSDSPFHHLAGLAERERLEDLIFEWLAFEALREQPFTVEHIERNQTVAIGGLPLSLRLDRVDRLSNGALVLIDYKSGEPKIKSLDGDRPSEPQLLTYATAMNEPIDGLFFAQMKPRKLRAIGYSREQQFPKRQGSQAKVSADWNDFLHRSTSSVESIAAEFVAGWASADPQKGACTWCNLKPLCRINAAGNSGEDNDDAD